MTIIFIKFILNIIKGSTTRVLTGSGDNTCRLWEATTGKQLHVFETKSAVRSVAFAFGDKEAIFVTDATMGNKSTIHFIKIAENPEERKYLIKIYYNYVNL